MQKYQETKKQQPQHFIAEINNIINNYVSETEKLNKLLPSNCFFRERKQREEIYCCSFSLNYEALNVVKALYASRESSLRWKRNVYHF